MSTTDISRQKKLTDFKVLSFDVYSTLVDETGGILASLAPLLSRLPKTSPLNDPTIAISTFHDYERGLQRSEPNLPYNELLARTYTSLAASLSLPPPSESEIATFSRSVPTWPAFPDTVPALQYLSKHYKLVPLSNIDNASIAGTCAGPLSGVSFDAICTAQEIGSYKPDHRNFEALLKRIEGEFGVPKDQVLHVANSLSCDIVPAKELGLWSCWIGRGREVGEDEERDLLVREGKVDWNWCFNSMGEMADAVKKELGE